MDSLTRSLHKLSNYFGTSGCLDAMVELTKDRMYSPNLVASEEQLHQALGKLHCQFIFSRVNIDYTILTITRTCDCLGGSSTLDAQGLLFTDCKLIQDSGIAPALEKP
jgi:hypothetical protein